MTALARSPVPADNSPPEVTAVTFVAPPEVDLSGLETQVLVRPAQPLSIQALQRSIQILFETGRFSNVLAYERSTEKGIEILFKLVPKRRISAITFRGNSRLSNAELRQASGLAVGDEFFSEGLRASVAGLLDAYRQVGYGGARIDYSVSEVGSQASLIYDIQEGEPVRATEVSISGAPGIPPDRALQILGWKPGMVIDRGAMDLSLRKLETYYRDQHFFRAQVGPIHVQAAGPTGAKVDLKVVAGPRMEFSFSGNLRFSGAELREALEYDGTEVLDDALLDTLRARLREFYIGYGFFDVEVRLLPPQTTGPARQTVRFEIEEGLPVERVTVKVTGATYFYDSALEKEAGEFFTFVPETEVFGRVNPAVIDAVGISGRPSPSAANAANGNRLFVPGQMVAAHQHLIDKYQEAGFLSVDIPMPSLEIDNRRRVAQVVIQIHEGGRTFLQSVQFEGIEHLLEGEALQAVDLHPVVPFSRSAVEAGRLALRRLYATRGFPFAKIQAVEELQPAAGTGDIIYRVDEGPFVIVDQVAFRGAVRTNDQLIRSTTTVEAGHPFNANQVAESHQKLMGLGVFDSVQIGMVDPDLPDPKKAVVVSLHERKPQSVVVGGGYSLVEGPRVSAEYDDVNLFGQALRLQANLSVNYFPWSVLALTEPSSTGIPGLPPPQALSGQDNFYGFGGRASIALTHPRAFTLYNIPGTIRTEVLVDRNVRPYYAFTRAAASISADWRPHRSIILSVAEQIEWDRIQTYAANLNQIFSYLSVADYRNLLFPPGHGLLNTIGPTVTWDRRNDPINPRRGYLLSVGARWGAGVFYPTSDSLIGVGTPEPTGPSLPVSFISTSGKAAGYVPIGPRLTAVVVGQIGRIYPLGGDAFVTPTQRYFLGGPDSNRGFQQDQMLPQDVRETLNSQVALCGQTASGASCSPAAQVVKAGNQFPSPGGNVFINIRTELRSPLLASLEGIVFFDDGNLWADAATVNFLKLRPAAGFGLRLPTPVGPAAFDVGFNLSQDTSVNEPLVVVQLAIVLF